MPNIIITFFPLIVLSEHRFGKKGMGKGKTKKKKPMTKGNVYATNTLSRHV